MEGATAALGPGKAGEDWEGLDGGCFWEKLFGRLHDLPEMEFAIC